MLKSRRQLRDWIYQIIRIENLRCRSRTSCGAETSPTSGRGGSELPGRRPGFLSQAGCGLGHLQPPDADMLVKALDHAWEQRGQPDKVMFLSD